MSKKRIFIQNGPKGYLKVVDEPGRRNESMICLCHGHLWLKDKDKSSRYLIGELNEAGENVRQNSSFSKLSKNEREKNQVYFKKSCRKVFFKRTYL